MRKRWCSVVRRICGACMSMVLIENSLHVFVFIRYLDLVFFPVNVLTVYLMYMFD